MPSKLQNSITDIPGITVGHAQDFEAITGCTAVLCVNGAVAGVDQRGGGPGTRETDLLRPENSTADIQGIMLAGGSAPGLDAASGAVRYLKDNDYGYDVGLTKIPLVPAAILFDLAVGDPEAYPDSSMGYQACENASSNPPAQGSVGAGTGATAGKVLGLERAVKSGIGTASMEIADGVLVGAIVAANPVGDILDPSTGQIVAGARNPDNSENIFADSLNVIRDLVSEFMMFKAFNQNTVIGVVATNAKFDKSEITRVARMAQNGVARCVRPAHTMRDGDTMFSLSTGQLKADVNIVGAFAAQMVQQAILNSVKSADSLGGIPAISDLVKED